MNVSVIIATYRRPDSLRDTLESFGRSRFPRGQFEVVVCDNADDAETRAACEHVRHGLDLHYLVERQRGKNAALNRAVEEARGELFLFTDDDVIADPSWIAEMWEGAERWPDHSVFGGKVLPIWPSPLPAHLSSRWLHGVFFTVLDPEIPEGPHEGFTPFGPNVGIRRAVFDAGHRYDTTIGPSGRAYIMGSEAEMVRRLGRAGYEPVFLPRSKVGHKVRQEQYSVRWLVRRSANYGRMLAFRAGRRNGGASSGGLLRLLREAVSRTGRGSLYLVRGNRGAAFNEIADLAVSAGRWYQAARFPEHREVGVDGDPKIRAR